ncbi:uncharacterized protein EAF01_001962 [Botrytis porri]|uniref:uncharacterized protein n=1 Tax=Botrytis porri TaxID=87229 RepID=UPI001902646B|nr:uncharacterized protein EAF01_001962 [Botrytis porri]KAF7912941.1 hypothetical protein EAF01_001962 [Botrytis porri]
MAGLGFAHHCYYSPMQQACRQDLKLWWHAAKQRMDQEFRLITIPFPAVIIQNGETFDHTVVHGNTKDLYAKNDFNCADHLTAYVVHSAIKERNMSKYGLGSAQLKEGSEQQLAWRNLAADTLGKYHGMFEKGYFQDITSKKKYLGYSNLVKSEHFVGRNNRSWALVLGGAPVTFKRSKSGAGDIPFAASIVPYVAVTRFADGSLNPELENGMKYKDVRNAHNNLLLIFDKNVTQDGKYEISGFPVECHLITQNPVSQALVGTLSWDDQSVLNEAAKLLAMNQKEFYEWYAAYGKSVMEPYRRVFADFESMERGYGDKSYFVAGDNSGGQGNEPEPDVEGNIEPISSGDDEIRDSPGPGHGESLTVSRKRPRMPDPDDDQESAEAPRRKKPRRAAPDPELEDDPEHSPARRQSARPPSRRSRRQAEARK